MKCPCEKCISYAICNAVLKEMEDPDVVTLSSDANCISLRNYLCNGRSMSTVRKTRVLFNLPPRKWVI